MRLLCFPFHYNGSGLALRYNAVSSGHGGCALTVICALFSPMVVQWHLLSNHILAVPNRDFFRSTACLSCHSHVAYSKPEHIYSGAAPLFIVQYNACLD